MRGCLVLFLATECLAQTNAATTFEVASVKASLARTVPSGSLQLGCNGGPGTSTPTRFTCTAASIELLIRHAWRLEPNQLAASGGGGSVAMTAPGTQWLPAGIDIAATIPEGATQEQVRIMLQNLLIDRFKLAYHFEKRDSEGYELVVDKNGPKFKESARSSPRAVVSPEQPPEQGYPPILKTDAAGCPVYAARRAGLLELGVGQRVCVAATDTPMGELVEVLKFWVGRLIIDSTALKGKYDFRLNFSGFATRGMVVPASETNPGPTIFSAIQDQLGLRLDKRKDTIEFFVIDHVEKTPTEN